MYVVVVVVSIANVGNGVVGGVGDTFGFFVYGGRDNDGDKNKNDGHRSQSAAQCPFCPHLKQSFDCHS